MVYSGKKTVLICGGTNFLGPHLVKQLVTEGYDVTVCTRGIHKIPLLESVTTIVCDCINDEEGVKRTLGGMKFDVVIDCIAYCPKEVFNVLSNVNTTRYIQISSIGVYWDSVSNMDRQLYVPINEKRFDPRTYEKWSLETDNTVGYGNRKKYAECVAYQRFPECNPVSIRPAYVADLFNLTHEQNVRFPEIVDWIRHGKSVKSTNKDYAVCFTRVDEEAELILKLTDNSYNEPLNISSIGYVTIKDIVKYVAAKFNTEIEFDENGELPNFPSGINLDVKRLGEIGYAPTKLVDWFWDYVDYYCDFPIEKYRPWKTIKNEMDAFGMR